MNALAGSIAKAEYGLTHYTLYYIIDIYQDAIRVVNDDRDPVV